MRFWLSLSALAFAVTLAALSIVPAGASTFDGDPRFTAGPAASGDGWRDAGPARRRGRHVDHRGAAPRVGGLVAPLAAKVAEIAASCGARLISGVRHTFVAGTRRISLHASGKAADLAGNPSCIYQHLQGWPGGYSTDYGRVKHVHVSYDADGGREWGKHFVHGGRGLRSRHAKHRHRHHYARRAYRVAHR